MAITYPRDFPSLLFPSGGALLLCDSFEMEPDINPSVNRAGEGLAVENTAALWRADYHTMPLYGAAFRAMSGWMSSIMAPRGPVWAWDVRCKFPYAYQKIGWTGLQRAVGGASFDGTCTLSAVDSGGVLLTLSGLPAGFVLGPGDPLAFNWDVATGGAFRRAYHRVVSDAAVASSAGTLTVEVRPVTRGQYATGVTVYLEAPKMRAWLVPDSAKMPRDDSQMGAFSFSLRQDNRQV